MDAETENTLNNEIPNDHLPSDASELTENATNDDSSGGEPHEEKPAENSEDHSDQADSTQEDLDESTIPSNGSELDGPLRDELYNRGTQFEKRGKTEQALRCFMACIDGLRECHAFTNLPKCLHHIATIYYTKKEYEKAVQFIGLEKFYYETALIDVSDLKSKLENAEKTDPDSIENLTDDARDLSETALKANEYEFLAKLCIERETPDLALEYAAKATKMRQNVYGNDHPVTKRSLDFFTVVYAESGKSQYADAVRRAIEEEKRASEDFSQMVADETGRRGSVSAGEEETEAGAVDDGVAGGEVKSSAEKSILRRRKVGANADANSTVKKEVRFSETRSEHVYRPDGAFVGYVLQLLIVLVLLICIVLVFLVFTTWSQGRTMTYRHLNSFRYWLGELFRRLLASFSWLSGR